MDPISTAVAAQGAARLVDFIFTIAEAGLERAPVVDKVRAMEAEGASADQITDALQVMRQEQDSATQAKIDKLPA